MIFISAQRDFLIGWQRNFHLFKAWSNKLWFYAIPITLHGVIKKHFRLNFSFYFLGVSFLIVDHKSLPVWEKFPVNTKTKE